MNAIAPSNSKLNPPPKKNKFLIKCLLIECVSDTNLRNFRSLACIDCFITILLIFCNVFVFIECRHGSRC